MAFLSLSAHVFILFVTFTEKLLTYGARYKNTSEKNGSSLTLL